MFNWFRSLFSSNKSRTEARDYNSPYSAIKVWFDEESFYLDWPEKPTESLKWSNLIGVAIETNDKGPIEADVWWIIATKEKVLSYPSEATGANDLLSRLQQLETFNNEVLIEAMASTENQTFILWDHEGKHLTLA